MNERGKKSRRVGRNAHIDKGGRSAKQANPTAKEVREGKTLERKPASLTELLVAMMKMLLGYEAVSEVDRKVRNAVQETYTLRVFVAVVSQFIKWAQINGPEYEGGTSPSLVLQQEKKVFRCYRPKWGWRLITAKERREILSKPGAVPLLVDCPSGFGRNSVWLCGFMIPLSRKLFALLCVLLRNRGKVSRNNLPHYLAEELDDPDYEPKETTIETQKSDLQSKMRKAGKLEIHGAYRRYELTEPVDFIYIDHTESSVMEGEDDSQADAEETENSDDNLRDS